MTRYFHRARDVINKYIEFFFSSREAFNLKIFLLLLNRSRKLYPGSGVSLALDAYKMFSIYYKN